MSSSLMLQTLAVALGGAIGASLRFLGNYWVRSWWHHPFPLGTLIINVVGSFLMGLLAAHLLGQSQWPLWLRLALGAGLLGALTTFSTFSLETLLLLQQGALGRALLNVLLSLSICLVAVWLGFQLGR